ncbi:MAG: hypothetical protein R3E01_17295 [Pirellulaceae bacterium]
MLEQRLGAKERLDVQSARGRWKALYAFCVVALAVFMIGLAYLRPPVIGYSAQADLLYRGSKQEVRADALRQLLTEEQVRYRVAEVLSGMEGVVPAPGAPANRVTFDQWQKRVDHHLLVAVRPSPGSSYQVAVGWVGETPKQALAAAEVCCSQLISAHVAIPNADKLTKQRDDLQGRWQDSTAQLGLARNARDTYLEEELDRRRKKSEAEAARSRAAMEEQRRMDRQREDQARQAERLRTDSRPAENAELLAEIRAATDKVVRQREALQQMLETRTSEHPEIMSHQTRLNESEEHLRRLKAMAARAVPSFDVEQPDTPPTSLGTPNTLSGSEDVGTFSKEFDAAAVRNEIRFSDRYQSLQQHVQTLESSVRKLENELQEMPTDGQLSQGTVELITPVRITTKHYGGYGWGDLATLVLLASVSGAGVVVGGKQITKRATWGNVEDVRRSLPLTVVAAVSAGLASPARETVIVIPGWVRWATRAGESVLIMMAGLLLVVIFANQNIAAQMAREPFAAFSIAVDQLTQWLL